jgi:hypothetical protein
MKSGNLNFLEPSGPLQACNGTALPLPVPTHKRVDRDGCENYRGIALGNTVHKILSNIILGKIKPYIEKIMGDFQNGFRDGRSVFDSIFALKIINKKIWEYNQCTIFIYRFSKDIRLYT